MTLHRFAILLLVILALSGCNTQAKWTYPIHPDQLYTTPGSATQHVVGVLPFREERPVRNRGAPFLLYAIPLMPFGYTTYERPEAATMFNSISKYEFDVDEDLGKAATRSLEASGLFSRTYFTLGGETREADYMFQGTAHLTRYDGKIYSYGLSVFGPLLWYLGLPAGSSTNSVHFEFELLDRDQHVVWSYTAGGTHAITQGLYYNYGNDTLHFATLMERSMNAALKDLAAHLDEL